MNEIRKRLGRASYRYECNCDVDLDADGDGGAQMTCAKGCLRLNRVPEISKSYHLNGGSETSKPCFDPQSYAGRDYSQLSMADEKTASNHRTTGEKRGCLSAPIVRQKV